MSIEYITGYATAPAVAGPKVTVEVKNGPRIRMRPPVGIRPDVAVD